MVVLDGGIAVTTAIVICVGLVVIGVAAGYCLSRVIG